VPRVGAHKADENSHDEFGPNTDFNQLVGGLPVKTAS
jgi:hypothetical protein